MCRGCPYELCEFVIVVLLYFDFISLASLFMCFLFSRILCFCHFAFAFLFSLILSSISCGIVIVCLLVDSGVVVVLAASWSCCQCCYCLFYVPAESARFCEPMGAANPRSRSQGDRRDRRPAYVSPYVHRREGRRECKAFKYGYTLSTWPWVVVHPRS